MSEKNGKPPSKSTTAPSADEDRKRSTSDDEATDVTNGIGTPAMPVAPAVSATLTGLAGSDSLDRLVDTARDYARQATADNTNKAYAKDWAHFASWCRRQGADIPCPPRRS